MHLIASQATQVGQFISEPQLYEKYFPLSFNDKYLVFAPHSKDSKNYDFWQDSLSILIPILNKNNIKILQIGANNERPYGGCIHLMGQTNINQVTYLIKNSIGVLSTDTFAQHIADAYNVKSAVLISNNYSNNVKGYFNPRNQIVLEPPREDGEKPCLALQEIPKSINRIKPEQIAQAACKMLNLEYNFPYKTIYIGDIALSNMIISACDSVINPQQLGITNIIMDLTLNHNEEILLNQMNLCEVSIITNKPLSTNIFNHHRQSKRIKEIVYFVEEDNNPEFVKTVIGVGIPIRIISKLPIEKINNLKLLYMELGVIFPIRRFNPKEINELKDKDLSQLYFKSSKFYTGRNKLYPSKENYLQDKPIGHFEEISQVIDNQGFWDELDSYKILEKC